MSPLKPLENLHVPLRGKPSPTPSRQSSFVDDLGCVRLSTLSVYTSLHNAESTPAHMVKTNTA